MSDVRQIVSRLEESGGTLVLDGDRVRYRIPSGNPQVSGFSQRIAQAPRGSGRGIARARKRACSVRFPGLRRVLRDFAGSEASPAESQCGMARVAGEVGWN